MTALQAEIGQKSPRQVRGSDGPNQIVEDQVKHAVDSQLASKGPTKTDTATKTLNPSKNREKNMQNLRKAVAKLMKNYPPPAKW